MTSIFLSPKDVREELDRVSQLLGAYAELVALFLTNVSEVFALFSDFLTPSR